MVAFIFGVFLQVIFVTVNGFIIVKHLDDIENGDLIHTSDDKNDLSEGTKIVAIWNASKQNYFLR